MRIVPGNAQHIGQRESQQDSFGLSDFGDRAFRRHGGVMMVLCDGMGGLANGAIASRVAVDAMLTAYHRKQPLESIAAVLGRGFREAQRAVRGIPADEGSAGTTIVAAVVCQDRLYWASLGDSRLYLCRNGAPAVQLTEDDNIATDLARRAARGEISAREVTAAPDREALTGYLGSPESPQPHIRDEGLPLQPGDRVIACSDGVYRGVSPETMSAVVHRADAMSAAQTMVETVMRRQLPHQDNATVVVLEVVADALPAWRPETVRQGILAGAAAGLCAGFVVAVTLNYAGILNLAKPVTPPAVSDIITTVPPASPGGASPGGASPGGASPGGASPGGTGPEGAGPATAPAAGHTAPDGKPSHNADPATSPDSAAPAAPQPGSFLPSPAEGTGKAKGRSAESPKATDSADPLPPPPPPPPPPHPSPPKSEGKP